MRTNPAARLASAILVSALLACSSPAPDDLAPVLEEGYVESHGQELFFKTKGTGEPIVILHGGPGFDHRQFLPFIWELAADHKVIVYDQRGTGLSTGPVDGSTISIETFIDDIESIRKAFGIEKMNLMGHSWGGTLAIYYGLRHPERLNSLILASTTASAESYQQMRATYNANRGPGEAERLEEIYGSEEFKGGDPKAYEEFWRLYFRPYFKDPSLADEMDLLFTENTIKNSGFVGQHIFGSIGEFDLHTDLEALECPTLVLHGDADPLPLECAERIHASLPNSKLVILPDAGHWPFIDATEEFRSAIVAFLAQVDSAD